MQQESQSSQSVQSVLVLLYSENPETEFLPTCYSTSTSDYQWLLLVTLSNASNHSGNHQQIHVVHVYLLYRYRRYMCNESLRNQRIVLTLQNHFSYSSEKVSILDVLQLKSRWPANCGTRSWRCLVVRRVAFRALSGAGLTAQYLRRRVPVAASCIGTLSGGFSHHLSSHTL